LQPDFARFGTGGESAERLQAIVDAQSTQGLTISIVLEPWQVRKS
jgi:hypothetical protein